METRTVLDSLDLGIAIIERDGNIVDLNAPLINTAKGINKDSIENNYFVFLRKAFHFPELDIEEIKESVSEIFEGAIGNFEIEIETTHNGKSRYWNLKAKSAALKVGKCLIISHEDISVRKQLEIDLAEVKKMETVGLLAGSVAAEFNNILQVIMGHAELLTDGLPYRDPLFNLAADICAISLKAGRLNRKLLAFSKTQILRPIPMTFNQAIEKLHQRITMLAGPSVKIDLNLEKQLDYIFADASLIEQSIINMVRNSKEAMPDGGKISIKTYNNRRDNRTCKCKELETDTRDWCMLEIIDTGCGMTAEVIDKAFEPFFTTKKVGEGLGLGLSEVYGVAVQSGGHICIDSKPNEGATIRVCLPALVECVNEKMLTGTFDQKKNSGKKIFVAEDDHSVRRMVTTFLLTAGHQVQAAKSAEDALEMLKHSDIEYDLLVTDVIMHEMTGKELADQLKNIKPNLPVLFMSGYSDDILSQQGSEVADIHFIEKPFKKSQLLTKVAQILEENKN